jgi:hypothetical protein
MPQVWDIDRELPLLSLAGWNSGGEYAGKAVAGDLIAVRLQEGLAAAGAVVFVVSPASVGRGWVSRHPADRTGHSHCLRHHAGNRRGRS